MKTNTLIVTDFKIDAKPSFWQAGKIDDRKIRARDTGN